MQSGLKTSNVKLTKFLNEMKEGYNLAQEQGDGCKWIKETMVEFRSDTSNIDSIAKANWAACFWSSSCEATTLSDIQIISGNTTTNTIY